MSELTPSVSIHSHGSADHGQHVAILRPSSGWAALQLGTLWQYRELLLILTWRDIAVRYKQTALGVAWAVLQPALAMVVFTVFFGRLAKMPSDGVPYPIFVFAGLLPWQLFSKGMGDSSTSLAANRHLITKVYFPRLILPISAVLAGLVDFFVAMALLAVLMIFYHARPGIGILALPLLILFAVLTALTVGLWLSALTIRYRDAQYVVPFLTQFWLYATPIAYPASIIPKPYRAVAGLNPMTGVVDGFRWALLGQSADAGVEVWVSAVAVLVLLFAGLTYFRRVEKTFADIA